MKRFAHRHGPLAFALLLQVSTLAAVANDECPPGMVRGGDRCEHLNLCADGRPMTAAGCAPPSSPPPSPPVPPAQPATPPPATSNDRDCSSRVVFDSQVGKKRRVGLVEKEARRILLVGGKAATLIRRYSSDAATRGTKVDWERSEVFIVDRDGNLKKLGVERPDIGDQIAGVGYYVKLLQAADKVTAGVVARPEEFARTRHLDVVCGAAK